MAPTQSPSLSPQRLAPVVLVALVAAMAAPAVAEHCFAFYYCQHTFEVDGFLYPFDLSPMCDLHHEDYHHVDDSGHEYKFQVCGMAQQHCLPANYDPTYNSGVAVQLWGAKPNCTNTTCTNPYTNEPECCTQNCAVLGVEHPVFKLRDPSDPINGGLLLEHVGSPPSASDPFSCPIDPWTGAQYDRKVVYNIACDRQVPILEIDGVYQNETNACWFMIYMRSAYACGCEPDCDGKMCGNDGCGGSCGTCNFNEICTSTTQQCCARQCTNKNCGSDGCGGDCGSCPQGEFCSDDQVCVFPGTSSDGGCPDGGCDGGTAVAPFFIGMLVAAVLLVGVFVAKAKGWGPFGGGGGGGGTSFSRM